MGRSTPLLFQSKLVCFSLLYLFTSLFLALYTSLSQTKCLFRSSPFDPIQAPLFSYPSTYGEHKYAIPTHRTSCSSPVYFSEYWMVLKEIQNLCKNSSWSPSVLRYLQGKAETFAGNLSTQARIPYFVHYNESTEIPCGFLKKFPISDSDRTAMENCEGVVVVSAIFNDHDKIRQPRGLGSETLDNVCFFLFIDDVTLKGLHYHRLIPRKSQNFKIGAWRVVKVLSKELYENPAMNGVIPKYLVHRLFPNSKFSIWIDAKLQLVVDPLLLIHSLVVSENSDMAISKHPYHVHTMEEAMATARWQKWSDVDGLKRQMETYCENGLLPWTPSKLPYPSGEFSSFFADQSHLRLFSDHLRQPLGFQIDVPDSALILRKHGLRSNLFSCLLFNELEAFNPRDQLAFAYVRDLVSPRLKINMFDVEVFEQIVVEYRHNIKREGGDSGSQMGSKAPKTKKTIRASPDLLYVNGSCCSKCQKYLLEMWGEES